MSDTTKLLEENIGRTVCNINSSKIFFDKPPWVMKLKTKINKRDLSSVQFIRSVESNSLQPHELQHTRPPCPSPTPGVHSDSHPSSQWCHPAISSFVVPFSSCPQSFSASESFPMGQLFAWSGQSTGVSASASFLPKKSQGWSPSEWTGWISLQSKGLSRVFSNTTVQKHQFFGAQPSSQSRPSNPTPVYISRENYGSKGCMPPMIIEAIFTISKTWKKPKYPWQRNGYRI